MLVGPVASGRAGLGSVPTTCYDNALGKDRRRLVQEEVRAGVEELCASQMVGMRQTARHMDEMGTGSGPQDLLVRALAS